MRILLAVVLILYMAFQGDAQGLQVSVDRNISNLRYVNFDRVTLKKYKHLGSEKWAEAIKEAYTMLPSDFVEQIGKQKWDFRSNPSDWVTGYPGNINLSSSTVGPSWMTWEPLRKNGFTREEMLFVSLHEIAHIYSLGWEFDNIYINYTQYSGVAGYDDDSISISLEFPAESCSEYDLTSGFDYLSGFSRYIQSLGTGSRRFSGAASNRAYPQPPFVDFLFGHYCYQYVKYLDVFSFLSESAPTLYGEHGGQSEDFAESFALYVMWPEYLKKNFLIRYGIIKEILGREYQFVYPMTGSIGTRLVVQ